jgi:hypothetical protein
MSQTRPWRSERKRKRGTAMTRNVDQDPAVGIGRYTAR